MGKPRPGGHMRPGEPFNPAQRNLLTAGGRRRHRHRDATPHVRSGATADRSMRQQNGSLLKSHMTRGDDSANTDMHKVSSDPSYMWIRGHHVV